MTRHWWLICHIDKLSVDLLSSLSKLSVQIFISTLLKFSGYGMILYYSSTIFKSIDISYKNYFTVAVPIPFSDVVCLVGNNKTILTACWLLLVYLYTPGIFSTRAIFQYKDCLCRYEKSHDKDKTVRKLSDLNHWEPYAGKTVALYQCAPMITFDLESFFLFLQWLCFFSKSERNG